MRPELEAAVRGAGCRVAGPEIAGLARVECNDFAGKVALLDGAATADARYRPEVRRLALAIVKGLPRLDAAHVAPAIHQAVRDRVRFVGEGIETFDDPIATWNQAAGDCDDFARLLLALYRSLGLKARLVAWEKLGKGGGHATVQVWDGSAWRWAEASIKARFGEEPKDAYRRLHPRGGGARAELGELAGLGELEAEPASDAASHARARSLILGAWPGVPGAPPASPPAVQAAHAIALLETSLGTWPGVPAMASSHNWGAVQVPGVRPPCPAGSQESGDSHADGSKYRACFRVYPDDAAGVASFLGVLFATRVRREAIGSGDADELARAMLTPPVYAEGTGRTFGQRVANYRDRHFLPAVEAVARSMREGSLWRPASRTGLWIGLGATGVAVLGGAAWFRWGRRHG